MKKKPYHLRKVYSSEEKEVLSQAIKNGFWRDDRLDKIRKLSVELSKVNNIEPPAIVVVEGTNPRYDIEAKTIILGKPSLVTFLHQFVFHKFSKYVPPAFFEDYARAYALGLFKECDPVNFKKAAKSGRLIHVDPINYKGQ